MSITEDISLDIHEYSDQASSSAYNIFENNKEIQFSSLKYSESNEYIRTPDLMEPDDILLSQELSLTNAPNKKKLINAGIFASDYYQLPSEVLKYTEVEIAVCPVKKVDPVPITLPEPSDYNVIDFEQTKNVSQKMFKSSGNIEGRITRHDSTLENA